MYFDARLPCDLRQFQLVMSEVKTFHLMALSRTSRDLIALTIRCFHAKKWQAQNEKIFSFLKPLHFESLGD